MGHNPSFKAAIAAVCLAGLLTLGTMTGQAEARVPAAQIYPAISLGNPLARDADTFEGDKSLYMACHKTVQNKPVCLCVTHVMKYELTLSEYRAAIRLYGQPKDRTQLHKTLKTEGITASEIGRAEDMEKFLTKDPDFAPRCAQAKAYYKTSAK